MTITMKLGNGTTYTVLNVGSVSEAEERIRDTHPNVGDRPLYYVLSEKDGQIVDLRDSKYDS